MSEIKILPETVSTKIAAGEVIERPASVVKELVENALDAGADMIRVSVEKAGVRLISVIDNGKGMDQDDAIMCFELHGTSKINDDNDLNVIGTYGFRGEAVPSVASVARVTLRTRQKNAPDGTEVCVEGGTMRRAEPTGCAAGSEFVIRDLFYNVPARRKFLKTDATEERHIYETILNMSLPNPHVAFELRVDGKTLLNSPAAKTSVPRLQLFFGKGFTSDMIAVDHRVNDLRIHGWIARHNIVRNSRREQRFFVNGRAIEAQAAYLGVRDGYGTLVEKGGYPPVILFLELDPQMIDVNVHPAKREIRFRHERVITHAIAEAIRETLRQSDAPTAAVDPRFPLRSVMSGAEITVHPSAPESPELFIKSTANDVYYTSEPSVRILEPTLPKPVEPQEDKIEPDAIEVIETPAEIPASEAIPELPDPPRDLNDPRAKHALSLIGVLDTTYILASFGGGLVIIDQHAAHERVLFERLLNERRGRDPSVSQPLLFPIAIELTRVEAALMRRYAACFAEAGFEIGEIGETTIMLNAIPQAIPQENLNACFHEILTHLIEEEATRGRNINYDTLARAACKAAVKAHDRVSFAEAEALIRQMGECEMPFSCPHGRPTVIHISKNELERRFGRR